MDPKVRIFWSAQCAYRPCPEWLETWSPEPTISISSAWTIYYPDTPGATFVSAYGALLRRVRRQVKYGQARSSVLAKNGREAAVERESTRLAACKNTNFVFDGVCSPILARYGFYDLVLRVFDNGVDLNFRINSG